MGLDEPINEYTIHITVYGDEIIANSYKSGQKTNSFCGNEKELKQYLNKILKNMKKKEISEHEAWTQYQEAMDEEYAKQEKNTKEVLEEISKTNTPEFMEAVNEWLNDEENGVWGDLKIVDEPIGEWQYEVGEYNDKNYWNILLGMFVNQSCGFSGDDYNGTLEIRIGGGKFLRVSFSL